MEIRDQEKMLLAVDSKFDCVKNYWSESTSDKIWSIEAGYMRFAGTAMTRPYLVIKWCGGHFHPQRRDYHYLKVREQESERW